MKDDVALDLAGKFRAWRRHYGLKLKEIEALTDIPARTLERLEQGRGFRYPNLLLHAMNGMTAMGREVVRPDVRLMDYERNDRHQGGKHG